jgi:hypothetical protein
VTARGSSHVTASSVCHTHDGRPDRHLHGVPRVRTAPLRFWLGAPLLGSDCGASDIGAGVRDADRRRGAPLDSPRVGTNGNGVAAKQPPELRDRISALRYAPGFIALIWEMSSSLTLAIMAPRSVRAATPLALMWLAKLIIGTVVKARQRGRIGGAYGRWSLSGSGSSRRTRRFRAHGRFAERLFGDLFTDHISVRIMEHAATLDLEQCENSEIYDLLEAGSVLDGGRTLCSLDVR